MIKRCNEISLGGSLRDSMMKESGMRKDDKALDEKGKFVCFG